MAQGSTADAAVPAATVPAAAATAADARPPPAGDNTSAAIKEEPIEAKRGVRADEQPDVQLSTEVSVLPAATPAGSASSLGVTTASTARKSGSLGWLGKAGGILGRWAVPVKVKKERKSGQRGVAATIDLT